MHDTRLSLLELTRENPRLTLDGINDRLKAILKHELAVLVKSGGASYSRGTWTMNCVQRVRLAGELIHKGVDPKSVSRLLGWQEFEDFVKQMLSENGFQTVKHVRFKTREGRREIDILAWNDTLLLAIDCKLWRRALSTSSMKLAAIAQVERVLCLAERSDLLQRLKVSRHDRRSIIPVILTLGELRERFVDKVPVVPVSKLVNFIYGLSPIDENIKRIRCGGVGVQQLLDVEEFSHSGMLRPKR